VFIVLHDCAYAVDNHSSAQLQSLVAQVNADVTNYGNNPSNISALNKAESDLAALNQHTNNSATAQHINRTAGF